MGIREAGPPPLSGLTAPPFSLERYSGGSLSLEELRGRVVMLDFWATWCPPCVAEMPHLVKLAREYEASGLVFVAANRDDAESARTDVNAFIAKIAPELAANVVFADDATAARYDVRSLPTLFLIDRGGKIVDAYSGFASESSLRKRIERALGAGGGSR